MTRVPKRKTTKQLKAMTERQASRYAMRLHEAAAEQARRDMEWDLFWADYYRRLLKHGI